MRALIARLAQRLQEALRLMVGVPDYRTYVDHVRTHHADRQPMTYEEFFRERQERRYGPGVGRCC